MLRQQFRDQSTHHADVNHFCPQPSAHHEVDSHILLGTSFIANSLSQNLFSTEELKSLAVDTARLHFAPAGYPHPSYMIGHRLLKSKTSSSRHQTLNSAVKGSD
jgi:hypothetical protein